MNITNSKNFNYNNNFSNTSFELDSNNFFSNVGMKINNIIFINPKEAYNLICEQECILVDLREDIEKSGKEFNIDSNKILHIPYSQFVKNPNSLPTKKPLILADSAGTKSKYAYQILLEKGYQNLCVLNGGILEWQKDGLPTIINDDEMLVGQCACKLKPKGLFIK